MIFMNNIVKRFGTNTVLSNVTFEAKEKEIFGLMGPSGAGKTTIINILTHQLKPDSGEFDTGAELLETGLMLDSDGLFVRLSCIDNLNVFAEIYGIPRKKTLCALKSVGLEEAAKKSALALSKGMKQRLALARAILHEPKTLFLDEPTSGLDPSTARGIHKLIKGLCDNGATVFLTTHNMDEAVKLCDHVALLHTGKIIERGAPTEICERYGAVKVVPDLEAVFIKLTGVELE
ncbi:MAG: ABC transporter ATP-binding protein [Defluviitaleaceae bacterium]|nr:ABC transporter ATP-binding protein [Defluviitaleaceae bacterium]